MLGREIRGDAVGFVVEDQIDLALAVQVHVLGAVGRDFAEAHDLEDRLQGARGRRCEFNKFKAHQAHWVFVLDGHGRCLIILVGSKGLFASKDEVGGRRAGQASHAAGEEVTKDEGGAESLHGYISL